MDVNEIDGLLDSGAFSDAPSERLTPDQALNRQLQWERKASAKWGGNWQANALVSYDWLIDETWGPDGKVKRRWSLKDAAVAATATVAAAQYLAARRRDLWPRDLVLACQGVDAIQYEECVTEVLKVATADDWIGLGGWCILGRQTRWMPTFWETIWRCLPRIAKAGVSRVHIFGVLYEPALAGLLWMADEFGLRVSTDSSGPILNCTWKNKKKAGVRAECGYWRCNVEWWIHHLANLRQSRHYRRPPLPTPSLIKEAVQ